MRVRHAVADEQDDVLGLSRGRIVDGPRQFATAHAVAHTDLASTRSRKRDVAQHQGRLILAVLALDEGGRLAEDLGMVLAIERDSDFCRIDETGELDFEIEPRARQDVGAVDRIDGLAVRRRAGR
jgi:hypothetical protein